MRLCRSDLHEQGCTDTTLFERAEAAAWNDLLRQGVQAHVDTGSINGDVDMRAIVRAILTAIHEPSTEMSQAGAEIISTLLSHIPNHKHTHRHRKPLAPCHCDGNKS